MSERIDIVIVGFEERFAEDFADLNYEWISKSYTVEAHDREILDHPGEQIIEPGGQIFFALAGEIAVGTVALIPFSADAFELAKMAVSPLYRGIGIGEMLMTACIEHSRSAGKRKIILESNKKQQAALGLYKKFGFVETPLDPGSRFARADIRMELAI